MTSVLNTECSNNEKQGVGIIIRYHQRRNYVCIRQFALFSPWKLLCKEVVMLSFMITSCFRCSKSILKIFFFHQWPYLEWPRTSNSCWKVLRKRSNLVWKSKLLRYSILKQIDSLKCWNKLKKIYNVEPLLILKYERHPRWERIIDEKEIS